MKLKATGGLKCCLAGKVIVIICTDKTCTMITAAYSRHKSSKSNQKYIRSEIGRKFKMYGVCTGPHKTKHVSLFRVIKKCMVEIYWGKEFHLWHPKRRWAGHRRWEYGAYTKTLKAFWKITQYSGAIGQNPKIF